MRSRRSGTTGRERRSSRAWLITLPAQAACVWAVAFAAVHLYWVRGGTVGLPPGMSVFRNTLLLAIDIAAIPLCLVAALLALALARVRVRRLPRRLLRIAAWGACAVLLVHSLPTIVGDVMLLLGLRTAALTPVDRFSMYLYEPWFMVGGLLFGGAAWCDQHRSGFR